MSHSSSSETSDKDRERDRSPSSTKAASDEMRAPTQHDAEKDIDDVCKWMPLFTMSTPDRIRASMQRDNRKYLQDVIYWLRAHVFTDLCQPAYYVTSDGLVSIEREFPIPRNLHFDAVLEYSRIEIARTVSPFKLKKLKVLTRGEHGFLHVRLVQDPNAVVAWDERDMQPQAHLSVLPSDRLH